MVKDLLILICTVLPQKVHLSMPEGGKHKGTSMPALFPSGFPRPIFTSSVVASYVPVNHNNHKEQKKWVGKGIKSQRHLQK